MSVRTFSIGGRCVGDGAPCYIVAEIGINHNGNLDLARRMIDNAKAAGADAVKFQNYRTEDFIRDHTLTYTYRSQGRTVTESQYNLFKRCELDVCMLADLFKHCDAIGIACHSTPTSEEGIMALVELGANVLKNGSDYITHLPLIAAMGRTNLPTVISTGMATIAEINEAVRVYRATGNNKLILLHCVSNYPASPESLNLAKIQAMASAFDCLVGFSDHSQGIVAAVCAVALGACWIEKHFTLDHELPGPDHWFSADPRELQELVRSIRTFEVALGRPWIGPTETDMETCELARLSCVAARPLSAGAVLTAGDITFKRPGTGLPPAFAEYLFGYRLRRNLEANEALALIDLIEP